MIHRVFDLCLVRNHLDQSGLGSGRVTRVLLLTTLSIHTLVELAVVVEVARTKSTSRMANLSLAGILVIAMFMVIGPTLIVLNQHILKVINFPYPMLLAGLGVVASGLFARILVLLDVVTIQRADAIEGWLWYSRVLPVGMAYAATLSFGNMVHNTDSTCYC